MNSKSPVALSLAALVGLAAAGCVSEPPAPLAMENLESISATVESIDIEKRLVGLKGERGRTATVEVSPDVRNLAQVRVGDKVVVRYYESLAAEVKKKGTSATLNTVDDAAGAVRAAPGDKPGAAVGSVVSTTVVIQSVDTKANVVDFTGPGGMQRTVHVVKPEAQQFIAGLKKGDEVEMTYTEALAVSVETQ